jgi:hypothetical protein
MSKALSYHVAAHRLNITSAELYSLVERGELKAERKFGEPPRIPIREITWYERCRDERIEREKRLATMPRKIYGRGFVSKVLRVFGSSRVIERESSCQTAE